MNLKFDIVRMATEKLGASPTVEQVVEFLYAGGAITDNSACCQVIGSEFYRMMAREPQRSARDIELELAARYDVCRTTVFHYRTKYMLGGRRMKRGTKKTKTLNT